MDEIRGATNGNFVLGSTRFQDEMAGMLKRRVVHGVAGRPRTTGGDDGQQSLL